MNQPNTAILHYSAPPVVGGVEAVIRAHVEVFHQAGYPVTVVAGRGEEQALPAGVRLIQIPEIDSQHPEVLRVSKALEQGEVPPEFDQMVSDLGAMLGPILNDFDKVIVHNAFTKHFNLPLTGALDYLLDAHQIRRCIAWCHDFTWTSPNSRSRVRPGHPWDLLRTYRPDVIYVTVSLERQRVLAGLLNRRVEDIHVVYNGVELETLLGLSDEGQALIDRLGLLESDLVLLMPVRVTRAKNIEFALEVVSELKARKRRPKLIVTGPPDPHDVESEAYLKSLQDLRRQLGVEEEMRFVIESGPEANSAAGSPRPYLVSLQVVGDLFRASDALLMPSHREGFAMPVLEAGLVGIPVFSTPVPAAVEIGGDDVMIINPQDGASQVVDQILAWMDQNPILSLRRRVRNRYTWRAIFERDIRSLLES